MEIKQEYLSVHTYVSCSDTYGPDTYMNWWPSTTAELEKMFVSK